MKPGIKSISEADIYNRVTDDILAFWYFGITSVPCLVSSPLRKDTKPSLSIIRPKGKNYLWWTDFATGQQGNMLQLLGDYWHVSIAEAKARVWKDIPKMPGGKLEDKERGKSCLRGSSSSHSKISCSTRSWRKHDLDYWNMYGISLKTLKQCEVYPVSTVIIEKDGNTWRIPAEKYAYCYVERKDDKVTLKIYQPYSKDHKWSNGNDSSVWNLWNTLPESGEVLVITSSRKDAMCILENTGYPSIALQGEGYTPKPKVMEELKSRFKRIFVLYDNDFQDEKNWGRILGKKICDRFGLKQIELPVEFMSKDPSDLCKNHGRRMVKKVIDSLVKGEKIDSGLF